MTVIKPFSLLGSHQNLRDIRAQVAILCHVHDSQVEDVYPCTPLQEGMLASTARASGDYIAHLSYDIRKDVCLNRLRCAWQDVASHNTILRTRIVSLYGSGLVQAVIDEPLEWITRGSESKPLSEECSMGLNTSLVRIVVDPQCSSLRLDIHHALYDGWSLPLLFKEVESVYHGETTQGLLPITHLIKHQLGQDDGSTMNFWQSQFDDICGAHFPPPRPTGYTPSTVDTLYRTLTLPPGDTNRDFTVATIIKAAWSVVVADATGRDEALFGLTVSGRQAPIDNIESVAGPAIATVPVRVSLDWEQTVTGFLQNVQTQATEMIPFEQTGLQRIRRSSQDAALACNFQTLMVIQPAKKESDPMSSSTPSLFEGSSAASSQGSDSEHFQTYPLVVECELDTSEVHVRFDFDPGAVNQEQVTIAVAALERIFQTLSSASNSRLKLRDVTTNGEYQTGIERIWSWNASCPEATSVCVHDLIHERVLETPNALAICAWDGNLTYSQLDVFSTQLAHHLTGKQVKGCVVPLLFEKSLWMPVAVLGVLKAGAAPVAVDVSQPHQRLQSIVSQARSPVVLASAQAKEIALGVSEQATYVLAIENRFFQSAQELYQLPTVSPHDNLYVVFTSGSTGTPKGVIITHRNFSSAITYQRKYLGLHSASRALDFASYAFDVAWSNLFNTLTAGGCLCIPSADERRNDLPGCLIKYEINYLDLTPSVARTLGRDALRNLERLILGGEAAQKEDAFIASHKTQVFNLYGPAECTPTITCSRLDGTSSNIGRGEGACTWLVNPDNPEQLAALGSVGELWVEGPLVGAGYLNNPEQTRAAFVDDPTWLLQGVPARKDQAAILGRRGRLYRTGDLVRYNDDGTLSFVGRKDDQLKIRGQRIELGEIEVHVRGALESFQGPVASNIPIIVDAIKPEGTKNAMLVAFLGSRQEDRKVTESSHVKAMQSLILDLTERLTSMLPVYMRPSCFIPILRIPVTHNGKADRKALRQHAEEKWVEFRDAPEEHDTDTLRLTDTERVIQEVWMSVLNLPVESVSVNKAFMRMGGDSISAMQVVSGCRLRNIAITVGDILQAGTIRNLALRCKSSAIPDEVNEEEDSDDPFLLSPIQQNFFHALGGLNHYNQSFALDVRSDTTFESLHAALVALVGRHAMLRARYRRRDDDKWEQFIVPNDASAFGYCKYVVESEDAFVRSAQLRQESLDIEKGPVFAGDMFYLPGGRRKLVLSAHHLVIDLVSWRIIWADIEDWIESGEMLTPPTASFQKWAKCQARVASNASPLYVLPYSIPQENLSYWGLTPMQNNYGGVQSFDVDFDRSTTDLIFGAANDALRTEAIDLILGALGHAFTETFTDRSLPAIWIEGHGREALDNRVIDVSHTVGWFTTLLPLASELSQTDSTSHAIRLVKDTRRKVPGKGQPYFAARYHSESGRQAFEKHGEVVEIQFNFTGRFQQLEKDEGLFKVTDTEETEIVGDSGLGLAPVSCSAPRSAMIDITAGIENECLLVTFEVHKSMLHQDTLEMWGQQFSAKMQIMAKELATSAQTFTLADLPLVSLSYNGLDIFLTEQLASRGLSPSDISDVYPCSPLQEGMLLSQAKGSATYATHSVWDCIQTSEGAEAICPRRLAEAWKVVVARHQILSTIFMMHPEGQGFMQVVLATPKIEVNQVKTVCQNPSRVLTEMQSSCFPAGQPEHCFTIYQASNGQIACRLDASHAIYDAASQEIILEELLTAYDNCSLPPPSSFRHVIQYIEATPKIQRVNQWSQLLDAVQPCKFPSSDGAGFEADGGHGTLSVLAGRGPAILDFCREVQITHSTFFQIIWGMALSHFTGMRDVCFGSLTSGRDIPVHDIEKIVGPVATMLVCRVDLRACLQKVLRRTLDDSIKSLAIQHTSLADIQHKLGLSGQTLFNTSVSLQNAKEQAGLKTQRSLRLETCDADDAHEDDLSLSIGIGSEGIDAFLHFRESQISPAVAHEVATVLDKAVQLLLESHTQGSPVPLGQGLFKHLHGVEEGTATTFWREQFAEAEGTHFPTLQTSDSALRKTSLETVNCRKELSVRTTIQRDESFQMSTLMTTAWALLAARHTNTSEALFGAMRLDSDMAVPWRVKLDWGMTVQQALERTEAQAKDLDSFSQNDLRFIRRVLGSDGPACEFRTLLHETEDFTAVLLDSNGSEICEAQSQYALNIEYQSPEDDAKITAITAQFDCTSLEEVEMSRILSQLVHVYRQLNDKRLREQSIGTISLMTSLDLTTLWTWNSQAPVAANTCLHDLVTEVISKYGRYGDAPAIHGWDGIITYSNLDRLSTAIAKHLVAKGIKTGDVVPLCFEKSKWTTVAILGVMKAGGVCLLIDLSTQPAARIRSLASRSGARYLISSVPCEGTARQVGVNEVIVIGDDCLPDGPTDSFNLPPVNPSDALYLMFTSGSTGEPKGIKISHQNACSAVLHQKDILGFCQSSRILDFSSYAFDASWWNIINTLGSGGCLCVPSAEERDNIAHCIEKYNVTAVDLIPSVARRVEPQSALSRLSSLFLAGEAVLPTDAQLGGDHVQVWNVYGPAECTPTSTFQNISWSKNTGIGRGAGVCTWITNPEDVNCLAAVGAIGELCVEGPLVGEGYMNDPEKTAAAFIEDPDWLGRGMPGGRSGRRGRVYRTGDLVRYNCDGSLEFLGRKDAQVKVRGQRLELGEVEQHVRNALLDKMSIGGLTVVAEFAKIGSSENKSLVAFIAAADSSNTGNTSALQEATCGLSAELEKSIPQWMVPTAYIPMSTIPHTPSGKVDRRKLREHAASLRKDDLAQAQGTSEPKRPPKTETERTLQALWAQVLQVKSDGIMAEDSFFRLGGDSIGAMQLVMKARQRGIILTVREIFQKPMLVDLAALLASKTAGHAS